MTGAFFYVHFFSRTAINFLLNGCVEEVFGVWYSCSAVMARSGLRVCGDDSRWILMKISPS